jgi:polysaccharide biosynthesis protein PslH
VTLETESREESSARAAVLSAVNAGGMGGSPRARKLLFVSPRFLFPADSGGKIRTRDVLRGMKGGRFEITLASPEPPDGSRRFADELRRVCDRFLGWPEMARGPLWKIGRYMSLLSSVPVAVASDRSDAGCDALAAELARGPDVVVADFPHSTVLLPARLGAASVLFTHNVEAEIFRRHAAVASDPFRRALWGSQGKKMQQFEDAAARRFDAVVAVSERDGNHFRAVLGHDRVVVIPTGVDLDYFSFAERSVRVPHDGGTMVFTGSMDWLANVDGVRYFMDDVWPLIARARPRTKMVVVGHSPPRHLVRAAEERRLAWTFTGFVDDVRPPVRDADVYVIPLRVGGGTRIKAYEAMAMGCPVVSTSIGVEGLPVTPDRDCLIADGHAALSAAVLRLLDDGVARRKLAMNARRLVEHRFSAIAAAKVFEDACLRAVESGERAVR